MNNLERIHSVARLAGRPLEAPGDHLTAHRAAGLLDRGLLPLPAIRQARRLTHLEAGAAADEAHNLADAEAIGIETELGRRTIVAQYTARYGTIEILEREPRSDRLLRSLLADGPVTCTGVHNAAKAIGITDSELEAAKRRTNVVEMRTARTGRSTLELRSAEDAERPPLEPPLCGHPEMWRTATRPWRCTTCHPPAHPDLVHETEGRGP